MIELNGEALENFRVKKFHVNVGEKENQEHLRVETLHRETFLEVQR